MPRYENRQHHHGRTKLRNPQPDGLPSELYKWLNEDNRNILLKHLNTCWESESLEDSMNSASLATIYKKDVPIAQRITDLSLS